MLQPVFVMAELIYCTVIGFQKTVEKEARKTCKNKCFELGENCRICGAFRLRLRN